MARAVFALLVLAVACLTSRVQAVPKVSGAVQIRNNADFMYTSPYDNNVYLATYSGSYNNVQVVDLDTMTQKTSIQLPPPQNSNNAQGWLTLGKKYLYCATSGSGVNAYSLKDGTLVWSYPQQDADAPGYNPALEEVLFVNNGVLYGLDANAGTYKWNNTDHYYQGQPFVTAGGNNAILRTRGGDLVGLSLGNSGPSKNFHFKDVDPKWGGSALQAFQTTGGYVYVAVGQTGTNNVLKLDAGFGSKSWTTTGMTSPSWGNNKNNLLMANAPYQLWALVWAYNGTQISLLSDYDGSHFADVAIKSNHVNGLVCLNGNDMLSFTNSNEIDYYSVNYHTYTGKFAVPNATSIVAALPTKGGSDVVLLTDVPSIVVLERAN